MAKTVPGKIDIPIYEKTPLPPSQRPYLAAPRGERNLSRTIQLYDFRPDVFNGDPDSSVRFLSRNGFTAVKHQSEFIGTATYDRDRLDKVETFDDILYPEVEALIKSVTGCKTVFITHSFVRGPARQVDTQSSRYLKAGSMEDAPNAVLPMHSPKGLPPTRLAHVDLTPLGARRAIRFWRADMSAAATEAGIIEREDRICKQHGVQAIDKASDSVLHSYNDGDSETGHRYAAFSVWRPLKKVTRDPLAMSPRVHYNASNGLWQYDVRNPGQFGDWDKELELIRDVKGGKMLEDSSDVPWYYLSDHDSDEVLIIKLMDSLSLGPESDEAGGAIHASPDLGDLAHGDTRESVECRLFAFWKVISSGSIYVVVLIVSHAFHLVPLASLDVFSCTSGSGSGSLPARIDTATRCDRVHRAR